MQIQASSHCFCLDHLPKLLLFYWKAGRLLFLFVRERDQTGSFTDTYYLKFIVVSKVLMSEDYCRVTIRHVWLMIQSIHSQHGTECVCG